MRIEKIRCQVQTRMSQYLKTTLTPEEMISECECQEISVLVNIDPKVEKARKEERKEKKRRRKNSSDYYRLEMSFKERVKLKGEGITIED